MIRWSREAREPVSFCGAAPLRRRGASCGAGRNLGAAQARGALFTLSRTGCVRVSVWKVGALQWASGHAYALAAPEVHIARLTDCTYCESPVPTGIVLTFGPMLCFLCFRVFVFSCFGLWGALCFRVFVLSCFGPPGPCDAHSSLLSRRLRWPHLNGTHRFAHTSYLVSSSLAPTVTFTFGPSLLPRAACLSHGRPGASWRTGWRSLPLLRRRFLVNVNLLLGQTWLTTKLNNC